MPRWQTAFVTPTAASIPGSRSSQPILPARFGHSLRTGEGILYPRGWYCVLSPKVQSMPCVHTEPGDLLLPYIASKVSSNPTHSVIIYDFFKNARRLHWTSCRSSHPSQPTEMSWTKWWFRFLLRVGSWGPRKLNELCCQAARHLLELISKLVLPLPRPQLCWFSSNALAGCSWIRA